MIREILEKLNESVEDRLEKEFLRGMKKEGLSTKKDTSKIRGRYYKFKNYSVGVGTSFHDEVTVSENGEEIFSSRKVDDVLDFLLEA